MKEPSQDPCDSMCQSNVAVDQPVHFIKLTTQRQYESASGLEPDEGDHHCVKKAEISKSACACLVLPSPEDTCARNRPRAKGAVGNE
eukprot:3473755-Amphidinium_carterae.2